jgi:hypothetical protein
MAMKRSFFPGQKGDYDTPQQVLTHMAAGVDSNVLQSQQIGRVAIELLDLGVNAEFSVQIAHAISGVLDRTNLALSGDRRDDGSLNGLHAHMETAEHPTLRMCRGMRLGDRGLLFASGWGGAYLSRVQGPDSKRDFCIAASNTGYQEALKVAQAERSGYPSRTGGVVQRNAPFLLAAMPIAFEVLSRLQKEAAAKTAVDDALLFPFGRPVGGLN